MTAVLLSFPSLPIKKLGHLHTDNVHHHEKNPTAPLEKARYSDGSVHKYSHFVPQREEGNFCVKMSDKHEDINLINCTRKGQERNLRKYLRRSTV
jgi:hypothetical protein